MFDQTKIVVAGIGGVGGYFGGLMAKAYADDPNIKIYFVARGNHLHAIQTDGLTVIHHSETFVAKPESATDEPSGIGIADYILICTKNFDLAEILLQLRPCIDDKTIILPLLNGIEGVEKIKAVYPHNLVLYGCAYIVSAIKNAGVVENSGNRQKIYFGNIDGNDERLYRLEKILLAANLDANLSSNILSVVWEKFVFLSALATATSYFNQPVGQLLAKNRETLIALVKEVASIAAHLNIVLPDQIVEKSISHYETLPIDATSSMHRDFLAQKPKNELNSLTGYVVNEALRLGIETPLFAKAYASLLKNN